MQELIYDNSQWCEIFWFFSKSEKGPNTLSEYVIPICDYIIHMQQYVGHNI